MNNTISVYIHIPFCVTKCPYCDFNSIATASVPDEDYIDAVLREMAFLVKERPDLMHKRVETIYIGGGTPSLVYPQNIKRLINGIRERFFSSEEQEITIEVNPGTVSQDRLNQYREAGINRLSIGVQSFSEKGLKSLGRIHSVQVALDCIEYARKAGFDNLGIDLIFGTPGQALAEWASDLTTVISMRPEHISVYNLTIERDTLFHNLMAEGKLLIPHEDDVIAMYELAIDRLESSGYNHYEISNFSLKGLESRHNSRYWLGMEYIGLGAGAHSYFSTPGRGIRWWNERDPYRYMQNIKDDGQAVAGRERLTLEEALSEGLFLGLREMKGIDMERFKKRFNTELPDYWMKKIKVFKTEGFLEDKDNHLRLTRKGILLSNELITDLMLV